jgi:putative peptidoglycan lipid II flippase
MSAQPKDRAKLTERAGIVALGTLLSRILGLGRDLVVAACFPRIATDAFMVAFQIPNILRQLLAEGAVQNAVLPVLSATIETEGEERGKDYFKNIRGLSLTILLVVTALGIWFSPEIVLLFAPGFADRPEQFEQTVTLTRWVFPFIIFVGTTALTSAALNVHQRFTASGFSPSLPNIAFILAALLLPAWLIEIGQPPILSLAIGAVVGGALQLFAQWPSLRAIGYAGFPSLRFSDPRVGETVRRMAPTLIGIGVYYLDVILGRRILSELGEGAVTYFGFALRLCDFPQGIFVMALQTATLPSLAALAARGQHEELSETFGFSVRLSLFVGLGAGALLVGMAEPLVRLLFERGEFGAEATTETARALAAQGAGVMLVAIVRQLTSVYFALGDTRTPVIVASMDLVVFVVSAMLLSRHYGHVGVSAAVTCASFAQMLLLWLLLGRRLTLPTHTVLASAARMLPGAALALGLGLVASAYLRELPRGQANLGAAVSALVLGVLYLGAARLLGCPEWTELSEPIQRRLTRKR